MEVIVVKVEGEEGGAVVAGVIGACVGPFAGDGLDKALGLAIGLRAVGFGELVFEAELEAGGGEEFGAVGGAAIGEDAGDGDAVILVEGDGLVEGGEDAGSFFVWKEGGEGESAVIVDGDVEAFDAGARVALGFVAGGADAGFGKAAELLDVEVEKIAGSVAFVAEDGRFGRFEGGETVQTVTTQDAGKSGGGNGENHADLGVGTALAAQDDDLGFEIGGSFAGLMKRSRRVVVKTLGEAGEFGTGKPAADGLFADAEGGGGIAQGTTGLGMAQSHLGSRERGESSISVHVVRAGGRGVECSSTTSLPDPPRADNLLKHDT